VVAEINEERAEAAMWTLAGKGDAINVATDISNPDSAQACVDATVAEFGTVHILVNNAALYYDIDNFDPSYEYLQKVFAVNQTGRGSWRARACAGDGEAEVRPHHQPVVGRGLRVLVSPHSATSSPGSATSATRSRNGASSASPSSWRPSSACGTSR
jgi:NAD(P)-dependent dehydrogenase (short-subunit alcohol dehydrogenase family)